MRTKGCFRLYLQDELVRRTRANPHYSLRAFARSLHTDFSTLSKILSGKRPTGRKTVTRIGGRLGLGPAQLKPFLDRQDDSEAYQQLALDSFEVISEWYHYAILEQMAVESFKPEPKWIARVLGISTLQVNAAVERLQRVGMLTVEPDGTWRDATGGKTSSLRTGDTSAALRAHQRQVLEQAMKALEELPIQMRDQTSITMAIDPARVTEAKELIKGFRRELAAFLCQGRKTDVYNLSVSLYPITTIKNEELPS